MCLIAWRWAPHSTTPLIWAANRDEFAHRATSPLTVWNANLTQIVSGQDLALEPSNGLYGTWSGVAANGRFAWLTNIRSPNDKNPEAPTRGHLVTQFLASQQSCQGYLDQLSQKTNKYNGFNLVVGQAPLSEKQISDAQCWHLNSRTRQIRKLNAGIYGLSNADLDSPWPKTSALVHQLSLFTAQHHHKSVSGLKRAIPLLFNALSDPTLYRLDQLPNTGLPASLEQTLSSAFIATRINEAAYGTRSSTVGIIKHAQCWVEEHAFNDSGKLHSVKDLRLPLSIDD